MLGQEKNQIAERNNAFQKVLFFREDDDAVQALGQHLFGHLRQRSARVARSKGIVAGCIHDFDHSLRGKVHATHGQTGEIVLKLGPSKLLRILRCLRARSRKQGGKKKICTSRERFEHRRQQIPDVKESDNGAVKDNRSTAHFLLGDCVQRVSNRKIRFKRKQCLVDWKARTLDQLLDSCAVQNFRHLGKHSEHKTDKKKKGGERQTTQ